MSRGNINPYFIPSFTKFEQLSIHYRESQGMGDEIIMVHRHRSLSCIRRKYYHGDILLNRIRQRKDKTLLSFATLQWLQQKAYRHKRTTHYGQSSVLPPTQLILYNLLVVLPRNHISYINSGIPTIDWTNISWRCPITIQTILRNPTFCIGA